MTMANEPAWLCHARSLSPDIRTFPAADIVISIMADRGACDDPATDEFIPSRPGHSRDYGSAWTTHRLPQSTSYWIAVTVSPTCAGQSRMTAILTGSSK